MSDLTPPHRSRRLLPAASLLALSALLAACGGGSGDATAAPTTGGAEETAAAPTDAPAATDAGTGEGSAGSTSALAALVPTDAIQAALGETPAPECDTSVLTGAGSCVWTAADGSWLKVEDSTPQEMPDVESFVTRVTGTLGLDQEVTGIGEKAYVGSSSRGTRIAVFLGEGRVVWAVINKPGDPATQADQVKEIATSIIAGL